MKGVGLMMDNINVGVHRVHSNLRAVFLCASLFMLHGIAAAATIDFEEYVGYGVTAGTQYNSAEGVAISTQGYLYSPGPNNASGYNEMHVINAVTGTFSGLLYPYNGTVIGGTHDDVVLSRADGGSFNLFQFDFSGYVYNGSVYETSFTVTGTFANGSTSSINLTPDGLVDGIGGADDFQTFSLGEGWYGLTSVTFEHFGAGTYQGSFALDNIQVSPWVPPPPFSIAPAGDFAPYGNPDGQLNVADVLILQRFVSGDLTPTAAELRIGDVAPLGSPDGQLNVADVLSLQRAILGEIILSDIVLPSAPILDIGPSSVTSSLYTVTGTAMQNIQVNLYVNNVLETIAFSSSTDGSFSVTVNLQEGINSISATVQESVYESAQSDTQLVILDTTQNSGPEPAKVSLITLTGNGSGTITATGQAGSVGAGTQVTVYTNTGSTVTVAANSDGSFSASLSGSQNDGVTVVVSDSSGNESDPVNLVAVGASPASFDVSSSGAASYTIPIKVPPGIGGMAPSLSLNYSSQSGNGSLGSARPKSRYF